MPQAANIVLADAQATPVNRTFVPIGKDKDGTFWFEDQSSSNAIGFWKISVLTKRPPQPKPGEASDKRTIRVEIGLHEPILENSTNSTVSGVAPAPMVSYTCRALTSYVMPERSSLQNRKDLRKMSANLHANAQVVDLVENLTYLW